jgi:hypothetical protein
MRKLKTVLFILDLKVDKNYFEYFQRNQLELQYELRKMISDKFNHSYLSFFHFKVVDILFGIQSISFQMRVTYLTDATGTI